MLSPSNPGVFSTQAMSVTNLLPGVLDVIVLEKFLRVELLSNKWAW